MHCMEEALMELWEAGWTVKLYAESAESLHTGVFVLTHVWTY